MQDKPNNAVMRPSEVGCQNTIAQIFCLIQASKTKLCSSRTAGSRVLPGKQPERLLWIAELYP